MNLSKLNDEVVLDDFDTDLTDFSSVEENTVEQKELPLYTKFDFEREVYGTDVMELIDILEYKKNIICAISSKLWV